MKVAYTHIVGVESDSNSVKIKFRPQGSDTADAPLSVQVNPHDKYIHLNLNFAEFADGGNCKNLPITPLT
jgi:hypothetical protein